MIFVALPDARHAAMSDYLRQRVGVLRRAAPGDASVPVRTPSALRFVIAAICGWLLWQPLQGRGASAETLFAAPTPVACADATLETKASDPLQ